MGSLTRYVLAFTACLAFVGSAQAQQLSSPLIPFASTPIDPSSLLYLLQPVQFNNWQSVKTTTGDLAATFLKPCSATAAGLLPPTGGGAGNILYSDCTFKPPGSGVGITQLTGQVLAGPGTGSVPATIAPGFTPVCLDPVAFGADPLGVADSKPALAAAVTALPTMGGCIQFSGGTFKLGSPYSFTYPSAQDQSAYSLGIYGSGITATRLLWPASDGIIATTNEFYQSFHLRDLSMETGTPGSYTAVKLTTTINEGNGLSDFTHVAFGTTTAGTSSVYCGGGAGACSYWGTAIDDAQSNVQFTQDYFYGDLGVGHGVGLHFQGIAGGPYRYSLNHHITDSYFWGLHYGIVYDSYTQGVSIEKSQFGFGCYQGIYSPATADPGPAGLELLIVANSDMECDNASVVLLGPVFEAQLSNNQFDNAGGTSAIIIGNTSFYDTIIGNWITAGSPTGSNGIYAAGGPSALTNSTIAANVFNGEGTAIAFNSAATNNTITGNTYNGVSTIVSGVTASNTRAAERNSSGLIAVGNSAEINPATGDYDTGAAAGGYFINSVPILQYSAGKALLGVSTVISGLNVSVNASGDLDVPHNLNVSGNASIAGLDVNTAGANINNGNFNVVLGDYFYHGVPGVTCSGTPSGSFAVSGGIVTHC